MTETEWLACTDPRVMLACLRALASDRGAPAAPRYPAARATDRKLRLFACACCRQVWHLLTDPRSRRAVEVAERYADGLATESELSVERLSALEVTETVDFGRPIQPAYCAAARASSCCQPDARFCRPDVPVVEGEAALLRCLFGNPFRELPRCRCRSDLAPHHASPKCPLSWIPVVACDLARAIYDDRRFGDLPILWDALSETGCQDEAIEAHCLDTTHARGCWVLDLLLGKT